MSLPISKQQLNKLGERIAISNPPEVADLLQLNEVLRAYQQILVTVETEIATLGLAATSRVKTRSVLIDKLRREHGMALARVQDMAGARIVVEGGRGEQDDVVSQLDGHFAETTGKASRIVDRRNKPSHGYRAVHLIVFPESVPVEIQVRTELQNLWAQIVERLADHWGRGIRYGEEPEDAELPAEGVQGFDGLPVSRRRVITDLRNMADTIAELEEAESQLFKLRHEPDPSLEDLILVTLGRKAQDLDADAARCYPSLRRRFKQQVTAQRRAALMDRRRAGRLVRRSVPAVRSSSADFVRSRLLLCNSVVRLFAVELRSHWKDRLGRLHVALQELGQYVERGGIR